MSSEVNLNPEYNGIQLMGGLVTCRVLFARAPVLGLCFFVSVSSLSRCSSLGKLLSSDECNASSWTDTK